MRTVFILFFVLLHLYFMFHETSMLERNKDKTHKSSIIHQE